MVVVVMVVMVLRDGYCDWLVDGFGWFDDGGVAVAARDGKDCYARE